MYARGRYSARLNKRILTEFLIIFFLDRFFLPTVMYVVHAIQHLEIKKTRCVHTATFSAMLNV